MKRVTVHQPETAVVLCSIPTSFKYSETTQKVKVFLFFDKNNSNHALKTKKNVCLLEIRVEQCEKFSFLMRSDPLLSGAGRGPCEEYLRSVSNSKSNPEL